MHYVGRWNGYSQRRAKCLIWKMSFERDRGKVMFIAGKKFLPVPEGRRYNIIQVLNRRSGGSIYRAHNVVFLTKKETDIR